jgi:CheY-like chemotaxis protein
VKIYLPRYANQIVEEEQENFSPELSENGETILIVEDDNELRSYLLEVLRGLGYRVLSAPHAQAALPILEQKATPVHLMLTDVVMPSMNGRELGRRAQQLRPGLRVLYMTGYSRNAVVHHGRLDEGVELLEKPITQNALAARVRSMLDWAAARN